MTTQRAGQPPHEGGKHSPVRPVQARLWVRAPQDGDLIVADSHNDRIRRVDRPTRIITTIAGSGSRPLPS